MLDRVEEVGTVVKREEENFLVKTVVVMVGRKTVVEMMAAEMVEVRTF